MVEFLDTLKRGKLGIFQQLADDNFLQIGDWADVDDIRDSLKLLHFDGGPYLQPDGVRVMFCTAGLNMYHVTIFPGGDSRLCCIVARSEDDVARMKADFLSSIG
jgi:hypothetical protein